MSDEIGEAHGGTRILVKLSDEERDLIENTLVFFQLASARKRGILPRGSEAYRESLDHIIEEYLLRWDSRLGEMLEAKLLWDETNAKDRMEFLLNLTDNQRDEFLADVGDAPMTRTDIRSVLEGGEYKLPPGH
jgi:hypothetical protein